MRGFPPKMAQRGGDSLQRANLTRGGPKRVQGSLEWVKKKKGGVTPQIRATLLLLFSINLAQKRCFGVAFIRSEKFGAKALHLFSACPNQG